MDDEEFNFEATRQSDLSIEEVLRLIKPFYPKVTNKKLLFLHHGTYNFYEIDDYIFRIPDRSLFNEEGYKLINEEVEKLSFLKNKLDVFIPEPIFLSHDRLNPIMGYKKISGAAIETVWPILNSEKKLILAKDLGHFLTFFHNPELTRSFYKKFNPKLNSNLDIKNQYENFYDKVTELAFPLLNKDIKTHVLDLFNSFFESFETNPFKLCLTHSDFDTSNILINKDTGKVVGIIDFEDSGLGDPASDFVFINEGKKFEETMLLNYKNDIDDFFKFRIKFYFQKAGLHYIIYGLEYNQLELVNHGIYLLKRRKNINYNF